MQITNSLSIQKRDGNAIDPQKPEFLSVSNVAGGSNLVSVCVCFRDKDEKIVSARIEVLADELSKAIVNATNA